MRRRGDQWEVVVVFQEREAGCVSKEGGDRDIKKWMGSKHV